MTLCYCVAVYDISIRNPGSVSRGVVSAELDGVAQPVADGKACLWLCENHDAHVILAFLG
jgi:hypothetical protein